MAGGAQPTGARLHDRGRLAAHSAQELVDDALAAKAQGFRRRQDQGRQAPRAEDVARLSAVRDAVGDAFEIMTDANQASPSPRRSGARAYRDARLAWLEEPLPADDLAGHVELAAEHVDADRGRRIALSPVHFREYLQRGACSIVQVDCARIGGITPWLKVAHLAEYVQRRRSARIS